MRYCDKCGAQVNEADDFCNACGSKLTTIAPPAPVLAVPPITSAPPPATPVYAGAPKPPSSGGKAVGYVISGVLVVALIALGFVFNQTSGKLNTANDKITSLQSDVAAKQGNIDSLNTQLTTEKANVASLQTQLTAAQANVTKLTSDLSASQASLTAAQGQIKTIQASLDTATASVTKLTSDLATANAKVTTTQASLDKATADLTKATSDLATANASLTKANADLAAMTTNYNNVNVNYKKVADPRHFLTVQELTDWLARDDTNTNLAYINLRSSEKCYILQIKASRDGLLLPATIEYASNGVYYGNVAIVGGAIYFVDVATDAITLEGTTAAYASHPLPLP
jgi:predicted  nucleic acid-binding Zn-ribbon protein